MQTAEPKRIVIKLPTLRWRSFLSIQFGLILSFLILCLAVLYWYQNIRPFLSITKAHLNAYSTTLSCDGQGRLIELGFQEGSRVRKGELLFSLDRELLLAKQTQTKSLFDAINQQAEAEKARIGKAMEAYLVAAGDLELGIAGGEKIQRYLGEMEEAQNKAEAAIAKAQSIKNELNLLDAELRKTTCLAPFDGLVVKRFVNEGAVVFFGSPIYTICDPDRLWVEAEVLEKDLQNIRIGTAARIQLSAYPNKEWTGHVSYIGDAATVEGVIPIKISIESRDASLKPGLSAAVFLKIR